MERYMVLPHQLYSLSLYLSNNLIQSCYYIKVESKRDNTGNAKITDLLLSHMAAAPPTTITTSTENDIPNWRVSGDWFDVRKCDIPCPCTFAQTTTYGDCDGIMAYHIKKVRYGEITPDDLNVLVLDSFKGNVWAGNGTTKVNVAIFFDEKANEQQREALNMIFSGKAGGFIAEFAKLLEVRGIEYAPIKFEVADDLSYWSAEIPGKVLAKADALTGPMTTPSKRVQTINPPGSEVGPETIATWKKSIVDEADAMGFNCERKGRSTSLFHLIGTVLRKNTNKHKDNEEQMLGGRI
jgi:hypothetical protein